MSPDSHIPARIRIGVTGHRKIDDLELIRAGLRQAFQWIDQTAGETLGVTEHTYSLISPLAEGADRIFADEGLAWTGKYRPLCAPPILEAILPLPADDYRASFESIDSVREFDELLKQAGSVSVVRKSGTEPKVAYAAVGRQVTDSCDVLITIFTPGGAQKTGGSAHIAEYARERAVEFSAPVIVHINAETGEVSYADNEKALANLRESLARLEEFNTVAYDTAAYTVSSRYFEGGIRTTATKHGLQVSEVDEAIREIAPRYSRADVLAAKYQRRYINSAMAVYILAMLAIASAVVHVLFERGGAFFIYTEISAMIVVIALLALSWRGSWQRKWLDYRSIAEQLRTTIFLRIARISWEDVNRKASRRLYRGSDNWLVGSCSIIGSKVSLKTTPSLEALRGFLLEAWIEDQRRWFKSKSEYLNRRFRQLVWCGTALFSITLGCAVFHLTEAGHHVAEYLSASVIVFPALASALAGIRLLRNYERHATRYEHMVHMLRGLKKEYEDCASLSNLSELVEVTGDVMSGELHDWRVGVQFHRPEAQ